MGRDIVTDRDGSLVVWKVCVVDAESTVEYIVDVMTDFSGRVLDVKIDSEYDSEVETGKDVYPGDSVLDDSELLEIEEELLEMVARVDVRSKDDMDAVVEDDCGPGSVMDMMLVLGSETDLECSVGGITYVSSE